MKKRGKTLQRRKDRQEESTSIEKRKENYDAEETRTLRNSNTCEQKGYS